MNELINLEKVHFVGVCCVITLQCAVRKHTTSRQRLTEHCGVACLFEVVKCDISISVIILLNNSALWYIKIV